MDISITSTSQTQLDQYFEGTLKIANKSNCQLKKETSGGISEDESNNREAVTDQHDGENNFPEKINPKKSATVKINLKINEPEHSPKNKILCSYQLIYGADDNKDIIATIAIIANVHHVSQRKANSLYVKWGELINVIGMIGEPQNGKLLMLNGGKSEMKITGDVPLNLTPARNVVESCEITEWMNYIELQPLLTVGDIVAADRGPYMHYGIVERKAKNDEIHLCHLQFSYPMGIDGVKNFSEVKKLFFDNRGVAKVQRSTLSEFSQSHSKKSIPVRLDNAYDGSIQPFHVSDILKRMEMDLGHRNYTATDFNCEHYVHLMRHGVCYSAQGNMLKELYGDMKSTAKTDEAAFCQALVTFNNVITNLKTYADKRVDRTSVTFRNAVASTPATPDNLDTKSASSGSTLAGIPEPSTDSINQDTNNNSECTEQSQQLNTNTNSAIDDKEPSMGISITSEAPDSQVASEPGNKGGHSEISVTSDATEFGVAGISSSESQNKSFKNEQVDIQRGADRKTDGTGKEGDVEISIVSEASTLAGYNSSDMDTSGAESSRKQVSPKPAQKKLKSSLSKRGQAFGSIKRRVSFADLTQISNLAVESTPNSASQNQDDNKQPTSKSEKETPMSAKNEPLSIKSEKEVSVPSKSTGITSKIASNDRRPSLSERQTDVIKEVKTLSDTSKKRAKTSKTPGDDVKNNQNLNDIKGKSDVSSKRRPSMSERISKITNKFKSAGRTKKVSNLSKNTAATKPTGSSSNKSNSSENNESIVSGGISMTAKNNKKQKAKNKNNQVKEIPPAARRQSVAERIVKLSKMIQKSSKEGAKSKDTHQNVIGIGNKTLSRNIKPSDFSNYEKRKPSLADRRRSVSERFVKISTNNKIMSKNSSKSKRTNENATDKRNKTVSRKIKASDFSNYEKRRPSLADRLTTLSKSVKPSKKEGNKLETRTSVSKPSPKANNSKVVPSKRRQSFAEHIAEQISKKIKMKKPSVSKTGQDSPKRNSQADKKINLPLSERFIKFSKKVTKPSVESKN